MCSNRRRKGSCKKKDILWLTCISTWDVTCWHPRVGWDTTWGWTGWHVGWTGWPPWVGMGDNLGWTGWQPGLNQMITLGWIRWKQGNDNLRLDWMTVMGWPGWQPGVDHECQSVLPRWQPRFWLDNNLGFRLFTRMRSVAYWYLLWLTVSFIVVWPWDRK